MEVNSHALSASSPSAYGLSCMHSFCINCPYELFGGLEIVGTLQEPRSLSTNNSVLQGLTFGENFVTRSSASSCHFRSFATANVRDQK